MDQIDDKRIVPMRKGSPHLLGFVFASLQYFYQVPFAGARDFKIGYISGNRRPDGQPDVTLPGLRISAALDLAVDDVNANGDLPNGHTLSYTLGETHGSESESIRATADLWRRNVSALIGPQETCVHEARMAASFNLPMISHFCAHYGTSDKRLYPTFARTRPPATVVSKSAASLLLSLNWTRVAFFHPDVNGSNEEYAAVAEAIVETFGARGIRISHRRQWASMYIHGWREPNFFVEWIRQTRRGRGEN